MAGKVIGKSMNLGYAGNYARTPDDIVVSRKLKEGEVEFGQALVLNSDNTYSPVNEDTVAADFAGIALRVVKQATSYSAQNNVKYLAGEMANALERGAATVVCNVGTPTAGGKVYLRVKEHASIANGVVGGFEASPDTETVGEVTTNYNIEIPNARWTNGYLDANRVAEVTLLTRVNP